MANLGLWERDALLCTLLLWLVGHLALKEALPIRVVFITTAGLRKPIQLLEWLQRAQEIFFQVPTIK